MKTEHLIRKIHHATRSDSGAAHLAVGALLVMTILYATTMV